jgi:drug/metabolite transporter (DMT)-like permease
MPLWIIAGIIPPLLWAIVNHVDKFLLSKAKHPSSVNVLMVYSTSFAFVILPIAYFFGAREIFQSGQQIAIQFIGGLLLTASIYCYLLALFREEASHVLPLGLLVPVFGYGFGYFLLGEALTSHELMACALIVLGALALSLEINEERKGVRIRHKTLFLMIGCSIFQAAQETLFKFTTMDSSFAVSIFWQYIGVSFFGILLVFFKKSVWQDFTQNMRSNGGRMFALNFTAESMAAVGYIIRDFSLLLAPVTIVMTLNGYQPAFVFVIGTILTIFFPRITTERIKPTHLLHKATAIAIMVLGTFLIAGTI